jgi:hypothetical protein
MQVRTLPRQPILRCRLTAGQRALTERSGDGSTEGRLRRSERQRDNPGTEVRVLLPQPALHGSQALIVKPPALNRQNPEHLTRAGSGPCPQPAGWPLRFASPGRPTIFGSMAQQAAQLPHKEKVAGANPARAPNFAKRGRAAIATRCKRVALSGLRRCRSAGARPGRRRRSAPAPSAMSASQSFRLFAPLPALRAPAVLTPRCVRGFAISALRAPSTISHPTRRKRRTVLVRQPAGRTSLWMLQLFHADVAEQETRRPEEPVGASS